MPPRFEQLLKHTNIPEDKLEGMLVLSLSDNMVIQSENIDDPTEKASMCLSMISASTSLAQSLQEDPIVRLLRVRTNSQEYFIVCDETFMLLAVVDAK